MTTRKLKELAEKELDNYDQAMIDDPLALMQNRLDGLDVDTIDEDLMEEIWLDWKEDLPEPDEWALDEAVNGYIDAAEQRYDMMKDEGLL
jgi:hypothetical protein